MAEHTCPVCKSVVFTTAKANGFRFTTHMINPGEECSNSRQMVSGEQSPKYDFSLSGLAIICYNSIPRYYRY